MLGTDRYGKSSAEYTEKLPCGGTLKVSLSDWAITYYFPGPDARHNGTFVTVKGAQVNDYILAWSENYAEYEKLRRDIPSGGEFTKQGKSSKTIRVGGFRSGVCLANYHRCVGNRQQLDQVLESYTYAKNRASIIMKLLASS
jgi:hypothetical protein